MQKTLGGDRLGAGKKMKVDLHNYERSTHDLGYIWRSTMAAGTLVPFLSEVALPGDTFDIDLDADIKTHPTIGPLFGSYKVQLDVFQSPIRLYNARLHNNMLGIGLNMERVKLPVLNLYANPISPNTENIDNIQINPSCILSYLGIRGVGQTDTTDTARKFNGIPILAYWDIYKNYYANKQEEVGAVIHTPWQILIGTVNSITATPDGGSPLDIPQVPLNATVALGPGETLLEIAFTDIAPIPSQIIFNTDEYGEISAFDLANGWGNTSADILSVNISQTVTIHSWRYITEDELQNGQPRVQAFDLNLIDEMRKNILANDSDTAFDIIATGLEPYVFLENSGTHAALLSSQEGLGLKTYQSDLFNNWLQTEWIDGTNGISAVTAIDTTGGSFKIDTLILARKVYNMLNRIAVSGGSYDDWLDAVYAHDRYRRCESPMYMGGLSKELVFQEVVSNSQSADQPLGTLAGRGVLANKHKGGKIVIKVDEPSYIIGIISLTPRLDYSQGNKWDVHLKTLNDLHKPALDEIGFQDLITEQMAWWATRWNGTEWEQTSAGKQPAWINYMTNVNQTRGNFAVRTNEMFMTLNRRYEPAYGITGEIDIKDLTTYIDPALYNNIFAETALDSQNFWAQIAIDITARRKMSAKLMPNL